MKRYPEYKDSHIAWLGEIPSHWDEIPIKRVILNRNGGAWGNDSNNNEFDKICLRVADFDFSDGRFQKRAINTYTIRNYTAQQIEKLSLQHGDIIIEKSGGGEKTVVGRAVLFDLKFPALFSNFMDRIRINNDIILSSYFEYYWRAMYSTGRTKIYIKQTTGIQNLNISSLTANESIPLPPLSEQDKIARYLDYKVSRINKLISLRKKQLIDLAELKKVIINNSVTKGLNPNAELKQSGVKWLGEIPAHWDISRLKYLFSFRRGLTITKSDLEESGVPVISYGQVHSRKNTGAGLNDSLIRYVNESYLINNSDSLVEKGDFIFADTSEDIEGCGNCAYIDRDGQIFAGYHSIIAHPNTRNNKYFAYLFLSSTWRNQIRSIVSGVKVYSITQKMLKDSYIFIPPLSEQNQIAAYLDGICGKIDRLITLYEREISLFDELKARLISDCVTGQLDLRDIII